MIKVKISTKKVLEVNKQNDEMRRGAGEPDTAGDQRYEYAGMEEDLELDEALFEKKDRCYKLAKRKFKVFPSAYAGAFMSKCRKGKIAKSKKNN